ncbi:MAG: aminomethyl-transferring glycine dehydrogenase [Planctomycetota bacterium]
MKSHQPPAVFPPLDDFRPRHLGTDGAEIDAMLGVLGLSSLDELVERTVPANIRLDRALALPAARAESAYLRDLRALSRRNELRPSFLGQGYYGTLVPTVLLRNVLENPGWYTQYTPYQAEISQGRLEALLNFQTMIADLTGLPMANASLLDEATAAAEALTMCHRILGGKRDTFFVSDRCHPQTIAVVRTRAESLGLDVRVGPLAEFDADETNWAAVLVQYPDTDGAVLLHDDLTERVHAAGGLVVVATDLLALTLLRPPGEFGADVVVGSSQRFGVPLGFGGPHAAFLATTDAHKRHIPGRMIGVSIDADGNPALRMALQTREQHIRREKATSNICTAQVLLAVMAGFYGVYHGPDGLRAIGARVARMTETLRRAVVAAGHRVLNDVAFDTLRIMPQNGDVLAHVQERGVNLRHFGDGSLGVALDETVGDAELELLAEVFGAAPDGLGALAPDVVEYDARFARTSAYLTHPVFQLYRGEHEMLRYLKRLENRDLSLTTSMIPLGSCTMKLNATTEMLPVTWPEFGNLHPFAPLDQTLGYRELFAELESWLAEITGFARISLQPNAGSQGEYAGLLAIRAYHASRDDHERDVCLIPTSAHGTNPASAVMAGMRVVVVACDEKGNVDLADLEAKARQHEERLAALMITYPSTHGVFEEHIREIADAVHAAGGLVYMDGANMNAQVGLCRPADFGADVLHLNLHKTFCIPHGGGGPGMGPIGVVARLAPFLPGHVGDDGPVGAVSAAPYGSPSILTISHAYIAMMGGDGLAQASRLAILHANYMAARLKEHYPLLYRGVRGMVAHEFILDLRPIERETGITGEDVAKRLMDYGYHAPTMSFPVAGTLMIEPTESESKAEIDRFCEALIAIRAEIRNVADGTWPRGDNPLERAPHTAVTVLADDWDRPYSREIAAFPAAWTRAAKFWPSVARVDNGYGDRNLVCACPPLEDYEHFATETQSRPVVVG